MEVVALQAAWSRHLRPHHGRDRDARCAIESAPWQQNRAGSAVSNRIAILTSRRDRLCGEPQTRGDVRSGAVTRPNRVAMAASRWAPRPPLVSNRLAGHDDPGGGTRAVASEQASGVDAGARVFDRRAIARGHERRAPKWHGACAKSAAIVQQATVRFPRMAD